MNKSTVIFHWEPHSIFNTPHAKKKLLNKWSFTCKAFGIYNLIAITSEELQLKDTEINFKVYVSLEEALKDKTKIVYLEEGGEPISNFNHPKDATYVFGSDYGELKVNNAITIKTNNALHAEMACAIVLYHRSIQWPLQ